jgi:hypothetical protein
MNSCCCLRIPPPQIPEHRSSGTVCVCMCIPPIVARQRLSKKLPRGNEYTRTNRRIVVHFVSYAERVLRSPMLGNCWVHTFPLQRMLKQQSRYCWTITMETTFSVGSYSRLYNEDPSLVELAPVWRRG